MYVLPFVSNTIDHWNYGEARILQYDANVGHHGTGHFLAEYWHGQVVVIEFLNGNAKSPHVYVLPVANASDRTPRVVTLSLHYVNPHGVPRHPDLVVSVTGFTISVVFFNTGDAFRV
jgi:hypothetical protein